MIENRLIICDFCKQIINLRSQIGYYSIPFIFNCPECTAEISGVITIDNVDTKIELLNLVNAKASIREYSFDNDFFCVELSAEFLTSKPKKRSEISLIGPFMRSQHLYNLFGDRRNYVVEVRCFADFSPEKWKELLSYYNLLWNNKDTVLNRKLKVIASLNPYSTMKSIGSRVDAVTVIHQHLLISTGILKSLDDNMVDEILNLQEIFTKYPELYSIILNFLDLDEIKLIEIEKKAIRLIDEYKNFYVHVLAIVTERKASNFINIDLEAQGISTVSYEKLKKFYASSFEWILDNIDIVIVMNNVLYRKDAYRFPNGKSERDFKKVNSKFNKLEFLDVKELKGINIFSLKNKVRNSIQHYNETIDYNNQKLFFTNTNGKRSITEETMYFSQFANLCIDNFSIIVYMYELVYYLRRYIIISTEFKHGQY